MNDKKEEPLMWPPRMTMKPQGLAALILRKGGGDATREDVDLCGVLIESAIKNARNDTCRAFEKALDMTYDEDNSDTAWWTYDRVREHFQEMTKIDLKNLPE